MCRHPRLYTLATRKTRTRGGLIFISLFLFCTSCDYYDNRLSIINNSNADIAVETYLDSIPTIEESNSSAYYLREIVKKQGTSSLTMPGSTQAWIFFIERSKNKKLNICVFNKDTIIKYGEIDSLINKNLYKKYIISKSYLDSTQWIVQIN
ncbi:MAG: hypothetical protein IPJ79_08515 [Bacteroidetes bacterium]|nr:hypothetical protein [Bacteroidota bacterium]